MKKCISIMLPLLLLCMAATAQIQYGYVRSQGTSYNRSGTRLPGVKVFVKGLNGAKVTGANGSFNFNLGGGKTVFSISNVLLPGYTLLSPLAPAYNVGKAPVEIVLQSRAEKQQNEARMAKEIEKRITNNYNARTRELQRKIAALEAALTDKTRNTDDLERQICTLKGQLGKLDDQYLKRNELIDKMVEEYVNLDYAKMDDRKAELCSYIESGELEKADSLLNTIDINKEMSDIKTLRSDIEEKESMLAKEKEIRKNKIETVCMYWRGKYDIAIQSMQYDSAAVYIKHLADVDSTNLDNVFACALFLQRQNCYKEAESYYNIILEKFEQDESLLSIGQVLLYNNLANLYGATQRFRESEEMLLTAISICKRLAAENPQACESYLARLYSDLANLYRTIKRFKESEDMSLLAIAIFERLSADNPTVYEPSLASSYNNLANLYSAVHRFTESEEMHLSAIAICKRLAADNPKAYEPHLFASYNNLAVLYKEALRFKESEDAYLSGIAIIERLAADNSKAYEPDLARAYNNLAVLYRDSQRFYESEEKFLQALAIRKRLAAEVPNAYEPDLASSFNNLAVLYGDICHFTESEEMYLLALAILERLSAENPKIYEPDLASSYNNLALVYGSIHRFKESEKMFLSAIAIRKRLAADNPKTYELDLASSYINMASLYYTTLCFKESEDMFLAAMAIFERLAGENPQLYQKQLAEIYHWVGRSKKSNNNYHDAIILFERSLKFCKGIMEEENDESMCYYMYMINLSMLVSLYINDKCYEMAYAYNAELLLALQTKYEEDKDRWRTNYNEALIDHSFSANLLGKFKEGEQLSLKALKVDSTVHFAYANFAASLLFQGKVKEAEKVYREYKGEFKDEMLSDFAEFERLEIIPEERKAEVDRIKAMLKE